MTHRRNESVEKAWRKQIEVFEAGVADSANV